MVRGKTVTLYINAPQQGTIFLMYTVQALQVKDTMQDFDKLVYDFDKNDLNLKTPLQTIKSSVLVTYKQIF